MVNSDKLTHEICNELHF